MKEIIEKIILTEKSSASVAKGKYTFDVNPEVNKHEVKQFIESFYKVKVQDVNMLNRKGKVKQRGRSTIQLKDKKRAVVTLAEGQVIDKVKAQF